MSNDTFFVEASITYTLITLIFSKFSDVAYALNFPYWFFFIVEVT